MLVDCDQHILLPRIHIQAAATPPPPIVDSKRTVKLFTRLAFPVSFNSVFQGRRHHGC